MTSSRPVLEVEDLRISIPLDAGVLNAVRGIDFSIPAGETLCLVGESGCGKSLTALAIMGLLTPRARREARAIRLNGQDLLGLSERRLSELRGGDMAMIFQDPMTSLNPTLDIGRQMTEGIRRHEGLSRREATKRAVGLLERVGLAQPEARLGQYPHQFSGGQRQRILVAMALMSRPRLLIADEPTTALDVTIQAQMLALIGELKSELGLALLMITHDLGVVASLADTVCVMYAGRIIERGRVEHVFDKPSHPYTRGLLAAIPIPGVTPPGAPLTAIRGRVPELIGEVQGCAFRARCSESRDACAMGAIPLQHARPGHTFECVHETGRA